ncbi:MAG: glutathione S-transferase [Proteobacteria bacterium]|nr:glutathione S-transferase [Pseudomonadota bacterium]
MSTLILHHFDWSPFAEKARLALGLKRLAWSSVEIPMVMPRPQLMPLTGGYRKTPVLQIGADVYCDTRLIAAELERRFPSPTLFPAGNRGLALALSRWSDTALFEPGAGLSMALATEVPEAVLADRRQFFAFMDFSRLKVDIPHMEGQLRANLELLEAQLADGRAYLLGGDCGWADITAYFPLWMARQFVPALNRVLDANSRTRAWEDRMVSIGHGTRTGISAEAALEAARTASPAPAAGVDPEDPLRLEAGDSVTVTPCDYGKVPVAGELVTLSLTEVAVRRETPETGTVVTHFPRIGYRIDRAA